MLTMQAAIQVMTLVRVQGSAEIYRLLGLGLRLAFYSCLLPYGVAAIQNYGKDFPELKKQNSLFAQCVLCADDLVLSTTKRA